MKIITLVFISILLSGCVTMKPYCSRPDQKNCKKIGAGEMGGVVRGFREIH